MGPTSEVSDPPNKSNNYICFVIILFYKSLVLGQLQVGLQVSTCGLFVGAEIFKATNLWGYECELDKRKWHLKNKLFDTNIKNLAFQNTRSKD